MSQGEALPPAERVCLEVRSKDLPFVERKAQDLARNFAGQRVALDEIVLFLKVPLKVVEVHPTSPAQVVGYTKFHIRQMDFVLPAQAETKPIEPKVEISQLPEAEDVCLGVRARDLRRIESRAEILTQHLASRTISPGDIVYFSRIPLRVQVVHPQSPARIASYTKFVIRQEEFTLPQDPAQIEMAQRNKFLMIFLALAMGMIVVLVYAYGVIRGPSRVVLTLRVKPEGKTLVIPELIDLEAQILQERMQIIGIEAAIRREGGDTILVRLSKSSPRMMKLLTSRGEIDLRALTGTGADGWTKAAGGFVFTALQVRQDSSGRPELYYEVDARSARRIAQATWKYRDVPFAFFLDGERISLYDPGLQTGYDRGVIKGSRLSATDLENVAVMLKCQPLPFSVEIVTK